MINLSCFSYDSLLKSLFSVYFWSIFLDIYIESSGNAPVCLKFGISEIILFAKLVITG